MFCIYITSTNGQQANQDRHPREGLSKLLKRNEEEMSKCKARTYHTSHHSIILRNLNIHIIRPTTNGLTPRRTIRIRRIRIPLQQRQRTPPH